LADDARDQGDQRCADRRQSDQNVAGNKSGSVSADQQTGSEGEIDGGHRGNCNQHHPGGAGMSTIRRAAQGIEQLCRLDQREFRGRGCDGADACGDQADADHHEARREVLRGVIPVGQGNAPDDGGGGSNVPGQWKDDAPHTPVTVDELPDNDMSGSWGTPKIKRGAGADSTPWPALFGASLRLPHLGDNGGGRKQLPAARLGHRRPHSFAQALTQRARGRAIERESCH
jgi:hypothetical protein